MALKPSRGAAPRGADVSSYAPTSRADCAIDCLRSVADIAKLTSDEIEDLRDDTLTELLYAGSRAT